MTTCLRRGLRVRHWALAASLLLALSACGQSDVEAPQRPPPLVDIMRFEPRTVIVEQEYAGRMRGSREVEVRARAEGILIERLFSEGQVVEEGQPLFVLDPAPFRIALQSAEAERANAQAARNQARREYDRIRGLLDQNAISRREYDRALAERELADAGLARADASVASAALNLEWSTVAAPVAGITGLETVSEGNLVSRGNLLTMISQLDPIHVRFSMPESDALLRRADLRELTAEGMTEEQLAVARSVRLLLPDGSVHPTPGYLDFTDSAVDPRTGTVSARAIFENPEYVLAPGQFVRVRVPVRLLRDVLLIPQDAVRHGRTGTQVFVVEEDVVHARNVRLGPIVEGERTILEGLAAQDQVVVSGLAAMRDGLAVAIRSRGGAADAGGGDPSVTPSAARPVSNP
jgi:membrane fusion protein, multidrug efflux system